jgi:hypothetical protein
MEKPTIPLGLTAAHGHSGQLGRNPTGWPMAAAFAWPVPAGERAERVLRAHGLRSPRPAHTVRCVALRRGSGLLAMRSSHQPSTWSHPTSLDEKT